MFDAQPQNRPGCAGQERLNPPHHNMPGAASKEPGIAGYGQQQLVGQHWLQQLANGARPPGFCLPVG